MGTGAAGLAARSQADTDRLIAELAARRQGLVARRELVAAGIDSHAIVRRVDGGRLHTIHPGVYAVGHGSLTAAQELVAGWLYGGPRSTLTSRGAVQLYGLAWFPQVDLAAPVDRLDRGRLVFHRVAIPDRERVEREGVRVTTPARTMLDLCAVVPEPRMRRIYTEAEVQGLIDRPAIEAILERGEGRRGVRLLRRIADLAEPGSGRIRSRLEARFRRFLADRGYPPPERNARLQLGPDVYEIDCLWRR